MDKIDVILVTHKPKEEVQKNIDELEANTPETHRLIATCQPLSASQNRNYGLSWANSEVFVMLDDDITGFYEGWLTDMVAPFKELNNVIVSSARLLNPNRTTAHAMGCMKCINKEGICEAERFSYKNYYRVPTSCITVKNMGGTVKFDEKFVGSGYEDTDWMNQVNITYPNSIMTVNNNCRLIHLNEEKGQGGANFEHNKAHYLSKYPDDQTVINQKDWTLRKR